MNNLPTRFKSADGALKDYSVYIRRIDDDVRVRYNSDTGEFREMFSQITEAEKEAARASVKRFIREEYAEQAEWLESRGLEIPELKIKACFQTNFSN